MDRLLVRGIELEVLRKGAGHPILLLHGPRTIDPGARFVELLSAHAEIIAPSHPGFGHSPRPADFDTVYDLVHLYLDLIEALPHEKITLVGCSFGGWLAAEIAAVCCHRLDRLILVDAFGIKLGDRESRDILDLFNTSPAEVLRRSWHDPVKWAPDFNAMSDDEAGSARAQLGRTVPLWLAAVHVQPALAALAEPYRRTDAGALGCERWRGFA